MILMLIMIMLFFYLLIDRFLPLQHKIFLLLYMVTLKFKLSNEKEPLKELNIFFCFKIYICEFVYLSQIKKKTPLVILAQVTFWLDLGHAQKRGATLKNISNLA